MQNYASVHSESLHPQAFTTTRCNVVNKGLLSEDIIVCFFYPYYWYWSTWPINNFA